MSSHHHMHSLKFPSLFCAEGTQEIKIKGILVQVIKAPSYEYEHNNDRKCQPS